MVLSVVEAVRQGFRGRHGRSPGVVSGRADHEPPSRPAGSLGRLLCLAAECGMTLDLEAHGPDAEKAVVALAELISARPHEIEESQVT